VDSGSEAGLWPYRNRYVTLCPDGLMEPRRVAPVCEIAPAVAVLTTGVPGAPAPTLTGWVLVLLKPSRSVTVSDTW
jgi:hypothetical protein